MNLSSSSLPTSIEIFTIEEKPTDLKRKMKSDGRTRDTTIMETRTESSRTTTMKATIRGEETVITETSLIEIMTIDLVVI